MNIKIERSFAGTSNWSGDYFISTGGIGFVINQTEAGNKPDGQAIVPKQLLEIFERDWNSSYAHPVSKYLQNTKSKTADKQEL